MTIFKNILFLLLSVLLLTGCTVQRDPLAEISDVIGADVIGSVMLEHTDSHGGFLGDGETVTRILLTKEQAAAFLADIQASRL